MKTIFMYIQAIRVIFFVSVSIVISSCNTDIGRKSMVVKKYPNLKIGFSTQNFQKAMPVNVESLTEIIGYASKEGYQFIEIRDDLAKLSSSDCRILADVSKRNKIDVIYEIHKNLLDSDYFVVFEKGLANTLLFPGPGILRTLLSKSEFDADSLKKGWTKEELVQLTKLADSCSMIAKRKNVQFIVENLNEAFFGNDSTYYGLNDFFKNTSTTGLQLDISNPFRKSSREKADPEKVKEYLVSLGNRWVTTHLKTNKEGDPQPILTENPLSIEDVVELMGKQNVLYVTIELAPVESKQQCYDNHIKSISFLKDKGILN